MRDYLVRTDHAYCVCQPLGSARASRDGTIMGLMELRNVMDGKLRALLGSGRSGKSNEPDTKGYLMVRGKWAPLDRFKNETLPQLWLDR